MMITTATQTNTGGPMTMITTQPAIPATILEWTAQKTAAAIWKAHRYGWKRFPMPNVSNDPHVRFSNARRERGPGYADLAATWRMWQLDAMLWESAWLAHLATVDENTRSKLLSYVRQGRTESRHIPSVCAVELGLWVAVAAALEVAPRPLAETLRKTC